MVGIDETCCRVYFYLGVGITCFALYTNWYGFCFETNLCVNFHLDEFHVYHLIAIIYLVFIELTQLLSPGSFVLNVALSHYFLRKSNVDFPFDHIKKDLLIHFAIVIAIETGLGIFLSLVAMPFIEGDWWVPQNVISTSYFFQRRELLVTMSSAIRRRMRIHLEVLLRFVLYAELHIQAGHGNKHSKQPCIAFKISAGNDLCNAGPLDFGLSIFRVRWTGISVTLCEMPSTFFFWVLNLVVKYDHDKRICWYNTSLWSIDADNKACLIGADSLWFLR